MPGDHAAISDADGRTGEVKGFLARSSGILRSHDFPFDRYGIPVGNKGPMLSREGPTVRIRLPPGESELSTLCLRAAGIGDRAKEERSRRRCGSLNQRGPLHVCTLATPRKEPRVRSSFPPAADQTNSIMVTRHRRRGHSPRYTGDVGEPEAAVKRIVGNRGTGRVGWDQPHIKRVASAPSYTVVIVEPASQRHDFGVSLLSGCKFGVGNLVEVAAGAVDGDVIMVWRHIAVKGPRVPQAPMMKTDRKYLSLTSQSSRTTHRLNTVSFSPSSVRIGCRPAIAVRSTRCWREPDSNLRYSGRRRACGRSLRAQRVETDPAKGSSDQTVACLRRLAAGVVGSAAACALRFPTPGEGQQESRLAPIGRHLVRLLRGGCASNRMLPAPGCVSRRP